MADNLIGGGDANVQQALISSQQRLRDVDAELATYDDALAAGQHDAEKRLLQKKAQLKKAQLKRAVVKGQEEGFERGSGKNLRFIAALEGNMGAAAQRWAENQPLQVKLTQALREKVLAAEQIDPARASQAMAAMARLAGNPQFLDAAHTAQAVGEVQESLLADPQLETPLAKAVLGSRYLREPRSDTQTKSEFLLFGMRQAQKRNLTAIKAAGDMLGTLADTDTPASAQSAALQMASRVTARATAGDATPFNRMQNVDAFVREPTVRSMPSRARGEATVVLARADGQSDVKDGLTAVARHDVFGGLETADKVRVFETIGRGRSGDLRAISDKVLLTLQGPGFPKVQAQVGKLLDSLARQVDRSATAGAASISPRMALRASRKSSAPELPTLASTAHIDPNDEDALRDAHSKNRAAVVSYYNKLAQSYDNVEHRINRAQSWEEARDESEIELPRGEAFDTRGLNVDDAFRTVVDAQLEAAMANVPNGSRQSTRAAYVRNLGALDQSVRKALGRSMTMDETTLVVITRGDAEAAARFGGLVQQRNRKKRDLKNAGKIADERNYREKAVPLRRAGAQSRYVPIQLGANNARSGLAMALNRTPVGADEVDTRPASAGPGMARTVAGAAGRRRLAARASGTAASPRSDIKSQWGELMASLPSGLTPAEQGAHLVGMLQDAADQVQQVVDAMSAKLGPPARQQATSAGAEAMRGVHGSFIARELNALMANLPPGLTPIEQAAHMVGMLQHIADQVQQAAASVQAGLRQSNVSPQGISQAAHGVSVATRADAGSTEAAQAHTAAVAHEAAPAPGAAYDATLAVAASPHVLPQDPIAAMARMVAEASRLPKEAPPVPNLAAPPLPFLGHTPATTQGKTNAWGLPQTYVADLGGQRLPIVRPAGQPMMGAAEIIAAGDGLRQEEETRTAVRPARAKSMQRTLVRNNAKIGHYLDLLATKAWKNLNSDEQKMVRNLQWDEPHWDAYPRRQLPDAALTPYAQLNDTCQRSVTALHMTPQQWDDEIAKFKAAGYSAAS